MVLSVLVLTSACTRDNDPASDRAQPATSARASGYFPGDDWAVGDPEDLGFDPAALERIAADAAPETNCLVVIRDGRLVGEWYGNGWTPDTTANVHSITQAYISTLVGIAQDKGLLDIDDPVADYLPEWEHTDHAEVTIRHVLNHTTGLRSTRGLADEDLLLAFMQSDDPGRFALTLPQRDEPGTTWSQNIPAIGLLGPILIAATGEDPAVFARHELFTPVGATHTSMTAAPNGQAWVHSFLESSCRDLGRFGHLILRQGNWDGTQVVSPDWVTDATRPSQDLKAGFGLMWWLNRSGSLVSIEDGRSPDYREPANLRLIAEAPEDMFWSVGYGGQILQIHPRTDTVVARMGEGPTEAAAAHLTTRIINEALDQPES